MSHNSFGHLFRITTWGESHGPAIGCVVDGCPPGIQLDSRRHPDLSRQAEARPVALHHPAQGAGPGAHPLRRVHRRGERRAGDHRHADRARDREHGRALQGLWGHQGQVPPRPRRLHLSRQIRRARLARLRPGERAGDREPRGGWRHRPQSGAGHARARRAGAGRAARHRPPHLGLVGGRAQPVLLLPTPRR